MNAKQYQMTIQMLELAADEFSSHVSNDYDLENTPENLEFVRGMIAASGYPEDEPNISRDGKKIYVMDWMVMRYCITLLKTQAASLEERVVK